MTVPYLMSGCSTPMLLQIVNLSSLRLAPQCFAFRLVIGASLSEPLLDELAGAFLWYIYIYIYIFVSMGSPFGPAWAPRQRATRKRKAGCVKVRDHTMSAKWGRKSVILFYASVRGLLTLKRKRYALCTDGESYHRTVA